MSNWQVDGQQNLADPVAERPGFGTIGGGHAVPSSFGGGAINKVIKPFDPAINFVSTTNGVTDWQVGAWNSTLYGYGEVMFTSVVGASIQIAFSGTAFSIYGTSRPDGGKFDVFIDGARVNGITNSYTAVIGGLVPGITGDGSAISQLSPASANIPVNDPNGFPAAGTVLIDGEQIIYTGTDTTAPGNLTGCIRGANGTFARSHLPGSNVYYMSSAVDTYTSTRIYRSLMYSARNLTPGTHVVTITMRSDTNVSSSGGPVLALDSFLVGGILGSGAISTRIDSLDIGAFTTDASGNHPSGIQPGFAEPDVTMIGILGIWNANHAARHQYDPVTGIIHISGLAPTTAYAKGDVKLTFVRLGKTL